MRKRLVRKTLRWSGLLLAVLVCASVRGSHRPGDGDGASQPWKAASIGVTHVRLDFQDRPIDEVVTGLRDRSGLPVFLAKPDRRRGATPLVSLSFLKDEPLSFWEAVERIVRPAGLQVVPQRGALGTMELRLAPLEGVRSPVSFDGPFRCEVLSVDFLRTLALGKPPAPNIQGRPVPHRGVEPEGEVGSTLESLRVQVQILPEPRLGYRLVSVGTPKVVAALDEKGRSLVLPEGPGRSGSDAHLVARQFGTVLVAELPLAMPDPPGDAIATLKGFAPFKVWTTFPSALDVPLANVVGRTFDAPGVSIKITRCSMQGAGPRPEGTVEMTLQSGAPSEATRASELDGITFHDDQGGLIFSIRSAQTDPSAGTNLTYRFPGQLPTRFRFAGSGEVNLGVEFEFAGIPLP